MTSRTPQYHKNSGYRIVSRPNGLYMAQKCGPAIEINDRGIGARERDRWTDLQNRPTALKLALAVRDQTAKH